MTLEESFRRLWHELEPIGRNPVTGGYHRSAWTPADIELRDWFCEQVAARDMALSDDRNGNQWAWWGAPGAGAIVTGSHLDSVPEGGAFDGPLGIVSAFLAIDDLRARRCVAKRPIAVVRFADEEGARFGVACAGSRLLTGALDAESARRRRDADGVSLADALRSAGLDPAQLGRDDAALSRIGAFIELHVEQGRALADVPAAVGIAGAIWPHGRWRLTFGGQANHAGTTRLADRRDPTLPFAATVLAARDAAGDAGALATFGKATVEPGGVNGIASTVRAWLDARAPDEATLQTLVADIVAGAELAAGEHGVSVDVSEESLTPVVDFDPAIRERLCRVVQAHLGVAPILPTGAGHDAGVLAGVVPTGMLFVRSPTGISHSPAETADVEDCLTGIRVLAAVLEDLAC